MRMPLHVCMRSRARLKDYIYKENMSIMNPDAGSQVKQFAFVNVCRWTSVDSFPRLFVPMLAFILSCAGEQAQGEIVGYRHWRIQGQSFGAGGTR